MYSWWERRITLCTTRPGMATSGRPHGQAGTAWAAHVFPIGSHARYRGRQTGWTSSWWAYRMALSITRPGMVSSGRPHRQTGTAWAVHASRLHAPFKGESGCWTFLCLLKLGGLLRPESKKQCGEKLGILSAQQSAAAAGQETLWSLTCCWHLTQPSFSSLRPTMPSFCRIAQPATRWARNTRQISLYCDVCHSL